MTRSAGPQIRGGESAAMVRFSTSPVECMGDEYDLLVALDWLNIERFADEIPLSNRSLILCDPKAGEVPALLRSNGAEIREIPFKTFASGLPDGRINMVALGAAAVVCGLPLDAMENSVREVLQSKSPEVVESALRALELGYNHDRRHRSNNRLRVSRTTVGASPGTRLVASALCVAVSNLLPRIR